MAPLVDPGATSVVAATAAAAARRRALLRRGRGRAVEVAPGCSSLGLIVLLGVLAGMLYLLARAVHRRRRPGGRPGRGPQRRRRAGGGGAAASSRTSASRWRSPRRPTRTRRRGSSSTRTPTAARRSTRAPPCSSRSAPAPRRIPVPDVVGSQVEQARLLLTGQGFTVKEEQVVDEEAPVGEVVDQEPGAERGGAPRLGGHALRVQGPGRPTGAQRGRQDRSPRPPTCSARPASP